MNIPMKHERYITLANGAGVVHLTLEFDPFELRGKERQFVEELLDLVKKQEEEVWLASPPRTPLRTRTKAAALDDTKLEELLR